MNDTVDVVIGTRLGECLREGCEGVVAMAERPECPECGARYELVGFRAVLRAVVNA